MQWPVVVRSLPVGRVPASCATSSGTGLVVEGAIGREAIAALRRIARGVDGRATDDASGDHLINRALGGGPLAHLRQIAATSRRTAHRIGDELVRARRAAARAVVRRVADV